jgi:hypothetical protein
MPMRTTDRGTCFTFYYLINTWLQPGAECGGAEKPFKRLSTWRYIVTALKRGVSEIFSGLGLS